MKTRLVVAWVKDREKARREVGVVIKNHRRDPCGDGTTLYLYYGGGYANLHI